jgi:hypothetical protein
MEAVKYEHQIKQIIYHFEQSIQLQERIKENLKKKVGIEL